MNSGPTCINIHLNRVGFNGARRWAVVSAGKTPVELEEEEEEEEEEYDDEEDVGDGGEE